MEVENLRINLLGVNKEAVIRVSLKQSVSATNSFGQTTIGEVVFPIFNEIGYGHDFRHCSNRIYAGQNYLPRNLGILGTESYGKTCS